LTTEATMPFIDWDEVHKAMRIHLVLANRPLTINIGS